MCIYIMCAMELLPKVHADFSSASYWENFFSRRKHSFEWYGNYLELCGILHRYIKGKDNILVVGCGNSELSGQLYDAGFHKITNVDISKTVLDQMRKKNENRIEMSWVEMDLTDIKFDDGSYSVVLDKGTLDAIMSDSSNKSSEKVNKIFNEISRILQLSGRYICVTLAQAHVLKSLLDFFPTNDWIVRIHKVWILEKGLERSIEMPVFAFVFTKFNKLPEKIFEFCSQDGIKPNRLKNLDEALDLVKRQQYFALLRHRLSQDNNTDQQASVSLYSSDNLNVPRYNIHVIEAKNHKLINKFGVFIVPRGREREWLFNSDEGRRQVAESAQFKRLAFVSLSRDHDYKGMEEVQDELSAHVMELAPSNLPQNYKTPFLSVGENGLGLQHICHRGESLLTGPFVVEDYLGEGGVWYRQLVFKSSLVQSDVRLKETRSKNYRKKKASSCDDHRKFEVDQSYFTSEYIELMIAGLTGVIDSLDDQFRVLVLGLGGGTLALQLLHYFPHCHVTAIEIDPCIVDVCRDWFGLSNKKYDRRLEIVVADALEYVKPVDGAARSRYDVIVLDIDTKDDSLSLRGPPPPFLTSEFLNNAKEILSDKGVFMINLNCRDESKRKEAMKEIRETFSYLFVLKCTQEVNQVILSYKANCQTMNESNLIDKWRNKAKLWEGGLHNAGNKQNIKLSEFFNDAMKLF